MSLVRSFLISLGLLLTCAAHSSAQDEPLFDDLTEKLKSPYFNLGVLMQIVGDFQVERYALATNGFGIATLRLILTGELDNGFGYDLKTDFTRTPSFLEARAYSVILPAAIVEVGLFKPHFSGEFLTGEASIDFVNRSTVVTALNPGRQIGVNLRGGLADKFVKYAVGVFNGNRYTDNRNDDNDFLITGRVSLSPTGAIGEDSNIEVGANAAYSRDRNAAIVGSSFEGKRLLTGADVRFTTGRWLLSGEAVSARLDHASGARSKPFGYHITGGYMIAKKTQVLLRWDSFGAGGLAADTRQAILGLNIWPTKATELQVNYLVGRDSMPKHHRLLVNAQLAF